MTEDRLVTEVPSSLKQLARLVVRGFYSIEDALIIDMLVRNPCMKEDDICELLKFERKQLRSRIAILKNDKFIQVRLKLETGIDGKAQKVNYYFINYKTFVNVVKYKLDLMRKRMETEERDATSRASFKCPGCLKTFTDLEADQLFDFSTGEFRCTYCREVVEEDQSAVPKKDSRLLLAKFNDQLEPLYMLLKEVEGIKLAPEVLEPEPVDISTIRGLDNKRNSLLRPPGEPWSGEASRGLGFAAEEARVDITIGDENTHQNEVVRKERPIWMLESTVITNDNSNSDMLGATSNPDAILESAAQSSIATNTTTKASDDIMSVLLAHEKKSGNQQGGNQGMLKGTGAEESDSSEDELNEVGNSLQAITDNVGEVETMDSDDDDNTPTVQIGNKTVAITDINDKLIAEMTPTEKEIYIQIYQEYYSHMYD